MVCCRLPGYPGWWKYLLEKAVSQQTFAMSPPELPGSEHMSSVFLKRFQDVE